jgi:GNAT superfamily N-acetyltransferase
MPPTTVTVRPMSGTADQAAFDRLNRLWIEQYFTITPEDDRVLSHPHEAIVEPGGAVLVAVDHEGTVLGVVALLAAGTGVFELAKMTVSDAARGRGVGQLLIRSAVDRAREAGAGSSSAPAPASPPRSGSTSAQGSSAPRSTTWACGTTTPARTS